MKKTKKIALIMLTVVLMAVCFIFGASAERAIVDSGNCGAEGDNVTWTFYDDGELVISGEGAMEDVIYKNWDGGTYHGGATWFRHRNLIEKVKIEEGVTTIGGGSFYEHSLLKEVEIASTVTTICWEAFCRSEAIEKIHFPENLKKIYPDVFDYCTGIKEFSVDPDNKYFSAVDGVLFNKHQTELIKYPAGKAEDVYSVPESVKRVSDHAFAYAVNLKEVSFSPRTTKMGEEVFVSCVALETVTLPEKLEILKYRSFGGCYNLKNIDFPESLRTIGANCFTDCASLEEVILPDNVTSVGYENFNNCESLRKIVFGDKIKYIPALTISNCNNLSEVVIGRNVRDIGMGLFIMCPSLQSIDISPENNYLTFEDGVLYNKDKTELKRYLETVTAEEYIMSSTVEKIKPAAFAFNMNLKTITISEKVKKIPQMGFTYCFSLETVNLPGSLEIIDLWAFDSCSNLKNIVIPEGTKEIGEFAFGYCESLQTINFPGSLERVDARAFEGAAVSGMSMGNERAIYENGAWFNKDKTVLVSVDESVIGEHYVVPDSVKKIGDEAFFGCFKLKSVIIPEGVVEIGNKAFSMAENLSEISFPSTIEKIGFNALKSTQWYRNLPEGMVYIGNVLYDHIGFITEDDTVVIKEGTTSIAGGAFLHQSYIKTLVIPDSVKYIGGGAFAAAYNLEKIYIGRNLEEIGNGAFALASGIQEIYYSGTKEEWEAITYDERIFDTELAGECCLFASEERLEHQHSYDIKIDCCDKIYNECECGDTIAEEAEYIKHSFNYYVSDNDATCVADGTKTAECDNCDATDTIADEGSATGHSFTKYESNNDATCVADGTKTAECDNCDATDTVADEGSATGHSFTKYESNNDATCVADGTKTAECDNCDATDTIADVGSATGHSFTTYISDKNATCKEDGTKTAECDNCDATDTIADVGTKTPDVHTFTEWVTDGIAQIRRCTVCGHTETKVVTEDGEIQIESPEKPGTDFEVDEIKGENFFVVEEKVAGGTEGNVEVLKAFDINLKNSDGVHVQPNGTVKVKLPNDWSKNGVYKVYRVNDDGTLTDMNAYRQGSHLVFDTDHFSIYVIVVETEETEPEEPDTPVVPDTPDEPEEPDESECGCICHKRGGILGLISMIYEMIIRAFNIFPTCDCGAAHY